MIRCEGFTLRVAKPSDEKMLQKHANNKKIWANLTDDFPHPYTLKNTREWIKKSPKRKGCFAIDIDGEIAGFIDYAPKKSHNNKVAVMGYRLAEHHWGKGIITKAIKQVVAHAFKHGVKRIEARVYPWNPASKKVLEKNGFVCEGILRKSGYKKGKLVDEYVYAKIA